MDLDALVELLNELPLAVVTGVGEHEYSVVSFFVDDQGLLIIDTGDALEDMPDDEHAQRRLASLVED